MDDTTGSPRGFTRTLFGLLFTNRTTIAVISVVLLVAISTLPNLGVIAGSAFMLVALLLCVRQGSFGEIGFRRPESWTRLFALAIAYGVAIQLSFSILFDPLLERWTGTPVDVSSLDGMRGHLGNYLLMLGIGWLFGGFIEEMLFRGYLLKRIQRVLGTSPGATLLAIVLPALAFGLAHSYQDTAGMISTGLIGALFGALFVAYRSNLWMPILVHGFSNVVGITLIYTSLDKTLNTLLFG